MAEEENRRSAILAFARFFGGHRDAGSEAGGRVSAGIDGVGRREGTVYQRASERAGGRARNSFFTCLLARWFNFVPHPHSSLRHMFHQSAGLTAFFKWQQLLWLQVRFRTLRTRIEFADRFQRIAVKE